MAEEFTDHSLDVLVRMYIAIPKNHMVPRHLALLALSLVLWLSDHCGRLLFFGYNCFFRIHRCTHRDVAASTNTVLMPCSDLRPTYPRLCGWSIADERII